MSAYRNSLLVAALKLEMCQGPNWSFLKTSREHAIKSLLLFSLKTKLCKEFRLLRRSIATKKVA